MSELFCVWKSLLQKYSHLIPVGVDNFALCSTLLKRYPFDFTLSESSRRKLPCGPTTELPLHKFTSSGIVYSKWVGLTTDVPVREFTAIGIVCRKSTGSPRGTLRCDFTPRAKFVYLVSSHLVVSKCIFVNAVSGRCKKVLTTVFNDLWQSRI